MLVVALAVLAAVSTAAAIWFYFRSKSAPGKIPDAVYQLLRTTPVFRENLSQHAAERLTEQLHELLACVAVGIANAEGSLLSWAGRAQHHYVDFADHINSVRRGQQRATVTHHDLPSSSCRSCDLGVAMIVPLIVDSETEALLIVVAKSRSQQLSMMVDALARFVCIQFELARLDESKHALQTAEIKALRAQISPHFVYNALNTISTLIRTDPEEARELLQDFADFIRYSFRASGMFTSLAEELRNIDRYLTIESALYSGRLGVRMKIAPDVLSVVLPALVLQPIVENAVKHGLSGKPRGGTVTVIAEDSGDKAIITVEDDGVGMDPERLKDLNDGHRAGSHIGLGNVSMRMQQIFGSDYALMVETAPGAGTKVTLRLPKFVPAARPSSEEPE